MRREAKRHPLVEWPWVALVGLVILLGIWWFPGVSGTPHDTFGASWSGKKAYYLLVRDLFAAVDRETEFLDSALLTAETLVILGPARDPTAAEWGALYRWVREGGRLLLAARSGAAMDCGPFGVEAGPRSLLTDGADTLSAGGVSAGAPDDRAIVIDEDGEEYDVDLGPAGVDGDTGAGGAAGSPAGSGSASVGGRSSDRIELTARVETAVARGNFYWPKGFGLSGVRSVDEVLLRVEGRPQAIRREVGLGTLVVCASDAVFSNREIARDGSDQALLAVRLLEACAGGDASQVVFDESLNATGTPKAFGILFDPTIRHVSLQLLLCVVLFAWSGYRRFGPPLPPARGSRRNIREHAVALGNLYYKAGAGRHALDHYLEFFLRETGMRLHGAPLGHPSSDAEGRRNARLVARAAGLGEEEVAKVLDGAAEAVDRGRLPPAEAARRIGALAAIRRRIETQRRGVGR